MIILTTFKDFIPTMMREKLSLLVVLKPWTRPQSSTIPKV